MRLYQGMYIIKVYEKSYMG